MKNEFEIRATSVEDVPQILTFIKAIADYEHMSDQVVATEELLKKSIFDNHQAEVVFALENGQPIGFALFYQTFSTFQGRGTLFLEDLFIDPSFRHKGYGKQLFCYLAHIAKERGLKRMDWWVLDWNHSARDFYHHMGAYPLDGWMIYRLDNDPLSALSTNAKE